MAEVEFKGETFALSDSVAVMPMLKMAKLAKGGIDSNEMEAMVVMYDVLESLIDPDDWQRFESVATRTRATGDDLQQLIPQAITAISARPTSLPSDSSDGQRATPPSSAADSSSQVVSRLEDQGRPDLALLVSQARSA